MIAPTPFNSPTVTFSKDARRLLGTAAVTAIEGGIEKQDIEGVPAGCRVGFQRLRQGEGLLLKEILTIKVLPPTGTKIKNGQAAALGAFKAAVLDTTKKLLKPVGIPVREFKVEDSKPIITPQRGLNGRRPR